MNRSMVRQEQRVHVRQSQLRSSVGSRPNDLRRERDRICGPAESVTSHIKQMAMMGEEYHLRFLRKLTQYLEAGLGSLIIKID
jgi:EAL domain